VKWTKPVSVAPLAGGAGRCAAGWSRAAVRLGVLDERRERLYVINFKFVIFYLPGKAVCARYSLFFPGTG
jgi:hypothetical protein